MVMPYKPQQGDIVILEFSPQTGHEQKGRRPALIISNHLFHHYTNLAMVCPISRTNRGFPLHVPLDKRTKTGGVIMCEQVKSLDIKARHAGFLEKAPPDLVEEILDIILGFIEVPQGPD